MSFWMRSCDLCTIFSDDFSSDRLATAYSTRSGSFSVGSGVLTTSSSNALLRCETAVPSGLTAVYAKVTMKFANSADTGRLVIAYTDDSNYWFVEVKPGTGATGTAKLYQRSGGTNNQIGTTKAITLATNTNITVTMCYSGTAVIVTVGTQTCFVHSVSISIVGKKCGVGTGSVTSTTTFDDFFVSKHTTDVPTCSKCDAAGSCSCSNCNTGTITNRVQVELPGLDPTDTCTHCGDFAGVYVLDFGPGDQAYVPGNASDCAWVYKFPTAICGYVEVVANVGAAINFNSGVQVYIDDGAGAGGGINAWSSNDGVPQNCNTWSNKSLAWGGQTLASGRCQHKAALPAAKITSLTT